MAADLELLVRHDAAMEGACPEPAADPRARHRQRLAEPEEQPRRGRTAKEQREALRNACGLPHSDGDYTDDFRYLRGPKPE